jgi:hypothetical protein
LWSRSPQGATFVRWNWRQICDAKRLRRLPLRWLRFLTLCTCTNKGRLNIYSMFTFPIYEYI